MGNTTYDWAKFYLDLGLSIFPVGSDKMPVIVGKNDDGRAIRFKFSKYFGKRPTITEIGSWWGKDGKYVDSGIGLIMGDISGISVVDVDDVNCDLATKLRGTVLSETPSGGNHWFFKSNENVLNGRVSKDVDIDLKTHRSYVILPPSSAIGRDGAGEYSWVMGLDRESLATICEFPVELFKSRIKGATKEALGGSEVSCEGLGRVEGEVGGSEGEIGVGDVLRMYGVELETVGGALQGSHPIHGSEGGMNFCVDVKKNVWKCFRCGSGGSVISLVAMFEGLIDCSESVKGGVRGDVVKKVRDILDAEIVRGAFEDSGSGDVGQDATISSIPGEAEVAEVTVEATKPKKKLVWYKDFKDEKLEPEPFVIQRIIPEKAITCISAATGTGKSIIGLLMARAVSLGEDFLGCSDFFVGKARKVLYLDLEMNEYTVKSRAKSIFKDDAVPVCFFYEQTFKVDFKDDFNWILEVVEEGEFEVIFLDTFNTIHSLDGDNNKDMSKINDLLMEIINRTRATIIHMHHNVKGSNNSRGGHGGNGATNSSPLVELARGATEIGARTRARYFLQSRVELDEDLNSYDLYTLTEGKKTSPFKLKYPIQFKVFYDESLNLTDWEFLGAVGSERIKTETTKKIILDTLQYRSLMTNSDFQEMCEENSEMGGWTLTKKCLNILCEEMEVKKTPLIPDLKTEKGQKKVYYFKADIVPLLPDGKIRDISEVNHEFERLSKIKAGH